MRCDIDGNLWCGWGMGSAALDGVLVFAPDGTVGRIALPERCANVCFGGKKRNRLFMAASQSLYVLYVNTQGAPGGVGRTWAPGGRLHRPAVRGLVVASPGRWSGHRSRFRRRETNGAQILAPEESRAVGGA